MLFASRQRLGYFQRVSHAASRMPILACTVENGYRNILYAMNRIQYVVVGGLLYLRWGRIPQNPENK
jgi:hypothetical protein